MRIIKKTEQKVETRSDNNREVRFIFDEKVQPCDWLIITHSRRKSEMVSEISVSFHAHPNALELILFQKNSLLEIGGKQYHFE